MHLAAKGGQQKAWTGLTETGPVGQGKSLSPCPQNFLDYNFLPPLTHLKPPSSLPTGTTGTPVFLRIPLPLPLFATPPWNSLHNKHSRSFQESKTSQYHLGTPKPPGPPILPQIQPPHSILLDPLCTPTFLSVLRHTHTPSCPVNTGTQSPSTQHHPRRTLRSLVSCSPPLPCEKPLDVWVPHQKQ